MDETQKDETMTDDTLPDETGTETDAETVELTPDEPALQARPEVDPDHERDIPHANDLQEPDGANDLGPGEIWTASPRLHIN